MKPMRRWNRPWWGVVVSGAVWVWTMNGNGAEGARGVASDSRTLMQLTHRTAESRRQAVRQLVEHPSRAAVPDLLRSFGDVDEDVRHGAAQAVIAALGPEAISRLTEALADAGPLVRRTALFGLGRMGPMARSVVHPLTQALSDSDAQVRAEAARTCGLLGSHTAVTGVVLGLGRLVQDPEAAVREAALHALGCIGSPAAAVKANIEQACRSDANPAVRKAALLAEWKVAGTQGLPVYVAALGDRQPVVRIAALELIGASRPAMPAHSKDVGQPVSAVLAEDPDPEVRAAAAKALSGFPQWTHGVVQALERGLADGDARVRRAIIEGACEREAPVTVLVQRGLQESEASVKIEALRVIATAGDRAERWVWVEVVPLLRDPDASVREAAAEALGWSNIPKARLWLSTGLRDASAAVQAAARAARERLKRQGEDPPTRLTWMEEYRRRDQEIPAPASWGTHPELTASLVEQLESRGAFWRIAEAANALRWSGPAGLTALIAHLRSGRPAIREVAVECLGLRQLSEAIPHVMGALRDPVPDVRESAVWALSSFSRDPRPEPAIRRMLNDDHPRVREMARLALEEQPVK